MAAAANDTYEETIDDQPSSMFDVAYPSSSIFTFLNPLWNTGSYMSPGPYGNLQAIKFI